MKLVFLCVLLGLDSFVLPASNSSKARDKNNINYFDGTLLRENQFHFASVKEGLCGSIVPGLQRMTRGIDITKLDLFHDYTADNNDGFVSCSFIELTCKKKRKFTLAGMEYDVPDQVLSIDLLPRETVKTHFSIISSLDEAKNEFKLTSGYDGPLERGAFSASASYQIYQDILVNTTKMISCLHLITPSTRIHLAPRTSLRKSLSEFMSDFMSEELPSKYEESPEKYQEFIENYGTHYFRSALFGGVFKYFTQIDGSVRESLSEKELTNNLNGYFMSLLSRKGVVSKVFEKKENKQFREKLSTNQSYYGGDAFLLEIDRYENWTPSLPRNPWLVNGQLAPMSELIRDETIRRELAKAIEVHMGLAYIQELKRILNTHLKKFPNKVTKISPLIEKIDQMSSIRYPTPEQVKQLIRELESAKFLVKLFHFVR